MFAIIVGANTENQIHAKVFEQLFRIAVEKGFEAPTIDLPVRAEGPLGGWALEHKGPLTNPADFVLAVTAPRVPGMSPIYPVYLSIEGPIFAVVVLDSVFSIWSKGSPDVIEVENTSLVLKAFHSFLKQFAKIPA